MNWETTQPPNCRP